ncbi:diguanylate cyclase [Gammaproteobacteria bacterium]
MLNEADAWKTKYLKKIDELESKERLWGELEEQMRQAIARVAIVGYGIDPGIDQRLDKLRASLRAGVVLPQIESMVREISDAATRIQESGQETWKDTVRICNQLLEVVPLPKTRQSRVQQLRKNLAEIDQKSQLPALIAEMTDILQQAGQNPAPPGDATPPGGLLDRLFGRREKPVVPSMAPTAPTTPTVPLEGVSEAIEATPPVDAPVIASAFTVAETLVRLFQPLTDTHRALVDKIKALTDTPSQQEAALLAAAGHLLQEALAGPAAPTTPQTLPAHEVLLQLLERISFPSEMQGQVNAFKSQLTEGMDTQRLQLALGMTAQLVGDMGYRLLREKQQLEEFLRILTERIQQIGSHLLEAEASQVESMEQGQEMTRSFQGHFSSMRQKVTEATDLEQIRGAIESSLDAVENHMTAFVQREEIRHRGTAERIRILNERLQGMEGEASQLREQIRQERAQSVRDPLTGLFNRVAYEERLAVEFQRFKRYGTSLSMLVLDIDFFKRVNDSYGHQAGDKVLKTIATRIAASVRDADFVCRFGGEEFVSLMPETGLASALRMAEKIRETVASCAFRFHGKPVPVTISCGVAEFHPGDTPETVFDRADHALYQAKHTGRNRCCPEEPPASSPSR